MDGLHTISDVTTTTELYWDPYDTEIDSNPHPVWKRMRDEAPVWWNDRYEFFAYSRYADVEMAHKDPGTYSSAHSTVLELLGPNEIDSEMMIFMDPPEHTVLRSLVSRAFTPAGCPRSRITSASCAPRCSNPRSARRASTTCRTSAPNSRRR